MPSTASAADAKFKERRASARTIFDMKRVSLLFRSTSSRIRRRLAVIVEAAAAGLASAGV
jgi:hypothetical protein